MFVDEATIEVKGGDGGNGIVAFRREKYVPLGGPSGGDGGNGGDVTVRADAHRKTLFELSRQRHHRGERGRHGQGGRRKGKEGSGVTVIVPIGTQIFDKETGQLLADMTTANQEFVLAHGGAGGRGNTHFSTSSRQAPGFSELGGKGEERTLLLSLKLLADVALIGLPNAGKSTLIASISAAKPKIADYPFTTLIPNLGVVRLDPANIFVAADIPGLIRGAHKGSGLGHQFLKHIERAPVFIHLVDPTQPRAWRNFLVINRELKMWEEELMERPQLVALTKSDLWDEDVMPQVELLRTKLKERGCEVFEISAATLENLDAMLWRANDYVLQERTKRAAEPAPPPVSVVRAYVDKPLEIVEIARYADGKSEWEVSGGALERLAGRFDLNNAEAIHYVHNILDKSGVLAQLSKEGVKVGDLVHVGNHAFNYTE